MSAEKRSEIYRLGAIVTFALNLAMYSNLLQWMWGHARRHSSKHNSRDAPASSDSHSPHYGPIYVLSLSALLILSDNFARICLYEDFSFFRGIGKIKMQADGRCVAISSQRPLMQLSLDHALRAGLALSLVGLCWFAVGIERRKRGGRRRGARRRGAVGGGGSSRRAADEEEEGNNGGATRHGGFSDDGALPEGEELRSREEWASSTEEAVVAHNRRDSSRQTTTADDEDSSCGEEDG